MSGITSCLVDGLSFRSSVVARCLFPECEQAKDCSADGVLGEFAVLPSRPVLEPPLPPSSPGASWLCPSPFLLPPAWLRNSCPPRCAYRHTTCTCVFPLPEALYSTGCRLLWQSPLGGAFLCTFGSIPSWRASVSGRCRNLSGRSLSSLAGLVSYGLPFQVLPWFSASASGDRSASWAFVFSGRE